MRIELKMTGLEELNKKMEDLASDAETRKVRKSIHQKVADLVEPRMRRKMPRSADNSKSGRKGWRPSGHAQDNIPKKVNANSAKVGWELNGDAENWFYMKFVEWGTSKQPPKDFLDSTIAESETECTVIAEEEIDKFLRSKLGG